MLLCSSQNKERFTALCGYGLNNEIIMKKVEIISTAPGKSYKSHIIQNSIDISV